MPASGVADANDEFAAVIGHLRADRPVVYPTSTLPALGVRPTTAGLDVLFSVKRRQATQPVSLAVARLGDASALVHLPERAEAFLAALPAGSVTIVFEARRTARSSDVLVTETRSPDRPDGSPRIAGADPDPRLGRAGIAIRVAAHPTARRLLQATGPLTATSANRSGRSTPPDCREAAIELGLAEDAFVPGVCPYSTPSTLIRWPDPLVTNDDGESPEVLRLGIVSESEVREAWMTAN